MSTRRLEHVTVYVPEQRPDRERAQTSETQLLLECVRNSSPTHLFIFMVLQKSSKIVTLALSILFDSPVMNRNSSSLFFCKNKLGVVILTVSLVVDMISRGVMWRMSVQKDWGASESRKRTTD